MKVIIAVLCLLVIISNTQPHGHHIQADDEPHHSYYISNLFKNRDKIKRTVTNITHGIMSRTWSHDPQVAAFIQGHVTQMKKYLETGRKIHQFDPLFVELFKHASKIRFDVKNSTGGVDVLEVGNDNCIAQMIQAHAQVVNLFIKNGHDEAMKEHEVPKCLKP